MDSEGSCELHAEERCRSATEPRAGGPDASLALVSAGTREAGAPVFTTLTMATGPKGGLWPVAGSPVASGYCAKEAGATWATVRGVGS